MHTNHRLNEAPKNHESSNELVLTLWLPSSGNTSLKWDEVDFERGLLFLPDSKTGKKTIALNAPALAVLALEAL